MIDKKYILAAFIVVALVQLAVPAKMISDREDILATGKEYKFRTMPIDPNDPFRGKYVFLGFTDTKYKLVKDTKWTNGETIYVTFKNDGEGYAIINAVSREKPRNTSDFLKTTVDYVMTYETPNMMEVAFPFERFYMDEYKAPVAETVYAESVRDLTKTTFALVCIKDGGAVLKDVVIDKKSIVDIVKERNNIQK